MLERIVITAALVAILTLTVAAHDAPESGAGNTSSKVTILYDHALPNVPGKSLRAVLVDYAPGGETPTHRHPASAFITATVIEGAIISKVNDGAEKTYRAGESFTENPGDLHAVSRNASDTERARLLAVFVLDTSETDLVSPAEEE